MEELSFLQQALALSLVAGLVSFQGLVACSPLFCFAADILPVCF